MKNFLYWNISIHLHYHQIRLVHEYFKHSFKRDIDLGVTELCFLYFHLNMDVFSDPSEFLFHLLQFRLFIYFYQNNTFYLEKAKSSTSVSASFFLLLCPQNKTIHMENKIQALLERYHLLFTSQSRVQYGLLRNTNEL